MNAAPPGIEPSGDRNAATTCLLCRELEAALNDAAIAYRQVDFEREFERDGGAAISVVRR